MAIQTETPTLTDADVSAEAESIDGLTNIGIELEYPVASDEGMVPVAEPHRSRGLEDLYNGTYSGGDAVPAGDAPSGTMTSDHVGAEIVSDILGLHTTEPEVWYTETIKTAEADGYPFQPGGRGETNFGLHMHISELPDAKRAALYEMSTEKWMRLFVCTSLTPRSADPWRHGGVSSRHFRDRRGSGTSGMLNNYSSGGDPGHYEWRLPEPMLPSHLEMVMHFLRLLSLDGAEAARDYAKTRVEEADRRLTSVQQFMELDSPEWRESATRGDSVTDEDMAEYTIEMYGSQ